MTHVALLDEQDIAAIAAFLERVDERCGHKDREVCLAADVALGWGPGAADWDEAKSPFLEALHKLFAACEVTA